MVTLFCAVVGVGGSAFPVDIDDGQSVGHMKDAINEKKKYRFPADKLQLFLAKTQRGGWLPDDDPAALKLKLGVIHPDIQTMIDVEQLEATREVKDVLAVNKMTEQHGRAPTSRQIHVLVVVPLEWHHPAAKYSLLDEEVVPRWTGGSPLLQLADQGVLWYGMKGSVGGVEGIDLKDERTLSRSALTAEIIERLEKTHVVLVKSPPMTGKTSLATLVSRALVHQHEENKKKAVVFNFSTLGISREGETFDQIFVEYCKVKWEYATVTLPASDCMVYLVLDETQLIYEEDSSLKHKSTCFWELVKRVQTDSSFKVRILMFAAYGSDVAYSRLATPTKFSDEMVFGIKELNFSHAEVFEYVTKWFKGRSSFEGSPSMMEAFCSNLEVLTGGHVGLCTSAINALNQVFQSRRKTASDFPSADEWISMLQTGSLYKPNDAELFKDLIETRSVKVLETLSVEKLDRLQRTSFGDNSDRAIIDECLRKGILAQCKHEIGFSSPVMWRYFVRLRVGRIERADHAPVTLPEMIVRVLSTVDYSSIRETLGRSFSSSIPLERALLVEFYKAAYRCTPRYFVTSADVGAVFGSPGFMDFTIRGYDEFWGVELLREANNLAERIERFSPGGHYSSLGLTDFCLIDFRCVGSIDESVMERIAADMGLCEKLFVVCYDARMTGVKVFNSVMKIVYQVDVR